MFDMFDETDEPQHKLCTIDSLRDFALVMFGRYLSAHDKTAPDDERAKKCTAFLSLQETENILRENSQVAENGVIGVGGDTAEEANAKLAKVMSALCSRILSNVLSRGVQDELLDCAFDPEKNDFAFSITERGMQIATNHRNKISGDS
jgi:hypothetical protein